MVNLSPKVSVVLPVYNVGPYLSETVNSILKQTFTNFELLIINDCSTDDTLAVAYALAAGDDRIQVLSNNHNIGRAATDNIAINYVRGEFIAKMDGDDICHHNRFMWQVAYLEKHPEVNVVGGWLQNFGASTYLNRYSATPEGSRVLTLFTLPMGNPAVMLRTSLFREGMMTYDASLRQTEDYDFFARYVRQLSVVTLPQVLIHYRVPPNASKKAILTDRADAANGVRERMLRNWGIDCTLRELHVHNTIAMLERPLDDVTLAEVEAWLLKLLAYNSGNPLFDHQALRKGLGERWFEVCYTYPQTRLRSIRHFQRSILSAHFSPTPSQRVKLWLQALRKI